MTAPSVSRAALVGLLLLVGAGGADADWPRFRGPDGLGVAAGGDRYPTRFGPDRNVLWKAEVPSGVSSPCIHGGRLFLTGFDGEAKALETLCLDRLTGKVLWRKAAPAGAVEKVNRANSPAAATPACDGKRVVVYLGSYGVLCYGLDGKELWKVPVPTPKTTFGTATSPIIAGDVVLLKVQGQGGALWALDVATGEARWKKEKLPWDPSYSLPLVRPVKGGHEVIAHGDRGIRAFDLKDGTERWSMGGLFCEAIPTPIAAEGLVYFVVQMPGGDQDDRMQVPAFKDLLAKHDKDKDGKIDRKEAAGVVLYSRSGDSKEGNITLSNVFAMIDRNKDGKLDTLEWTLGSLMTISLNNSLLAARFDDGEKPAPPKVVWREQKALPEVATPLCYQGRLYLAKHDGILTCLDAKTGKLLDRRRVNAVGLYYASPVAGDGKVYVATQRGAVLVLKAGDKLEVLARNDLGEPIAATPALVGGVVYLRTEKHMYAFKE
jgi:outer membrane protein assembly factor BamB